MPMPGDRRPETPAVALTHICGEPDENFYREKNNTSLAEQQQPKQACKGTETETPAVALTHISGEPDVIILVKTKKTGMPEEQQP